MNESAMNESAMNESPMNESLDNEIIHRWQGGQSQRGIAADLSLSRWRVCQTIRQRQAACARGRSTRPTRPCPRRAVSGAANWTRSPRPSTNC